MTPPAGGNGPAPPGDRALLNAATLQMAALWGWLAMLAVHESGHVLHAWLSGGSVTKVVLHPLAVSRTEVEPNPRPRFVAWGGPLWGAILPAGAWLSLGRRIPATPA